LKTLNQIIEQITDLGTAHHQIQSVGVGTIAELQAEERYYPLLWIFHETSGIDDKYLTHDIRLIVADRVITGEEGEDTDGHEQEVLSDSQLIVLDFLAYFMQQHDQEYVVEPSAILEPFTEVWNDRVAGHSVVIQIKQFFDWNKCQIPETGAAISPDVDGITLYDFCDADVRARLTSAQLTCLTDALCGACDPVTEQINGTTIGTAASGSTNNQLIKDTANNTIGTAANPSIVSNTTNEVNGVDISDETVAEGTHDQQIHDSAGSDVGTAANPSVVADATVRNNATPTWSDTVEAEGTLTLGQAKMLDSDGTTTVLADYIPTADGFMFTATTCGAAGLSVSVGLSDTTPNFGDVVTITITSSGTPTSYRFWLPTPSGYELVTQGTNTYAWTVGCVGSCTVYGGANEATATGYDIDGIGVTSTGYLLDGLITEPNKATAYRLLSTSYAALPIVNIRRSSDNATADFTAAEITDGTLTTWTGANDGLVTRRYDQSGNGNDDFQTTAGNQFKLVSSGILQTDSGGKPVATVVSTTQALRFYGFMQGSGGTVYASYKPLGGAHAGRYYYLVSRNANPAVGIADDNESSTSSTDNSAGTPTTKVNGAEISPEQRGALGTATLNIESIVTIKDVDWGAIINWISGVMEIFEWCDVDSPTGDMIIFNNNGTEQQTYIESEMNAYYGYY